MKPETSHQTLVRLIGELREYDHAFLTVEGALYFSKPFGFTARTYIAKANPDDPKGLTLYDGVKQAEGISAHELAKQICNHVGVDCAQKIGRGFQLQTCCDALEQWVKQS
jgi:hypothetical protein